LRRLGMVDFPADQLQFLIYGRVVDSSRAQEDFGFRAAYTTEQTIADFRNHGGDGHALWRAKALESA
ncbi:MAG: NAD-dependent epimerase/dehydratase family protein, partial [Actinomycetota bacterium]